MDFGHTHTHIHLKGCFSTCCFDLQKKIASFFFFIFGLKQIIVGDGCSWVMPCPLLSLPLFPTNSVHSVDVSQRNDQTLGWMAKTPPTAKSPRSGPQYFHGAYSYSSWTGCQKTMHLYPGLKTFFVSFLILFIFCAGGWSFRTYITLYLTYWSCLCTRETDIAKCLNIYI